MTAVAPASSSRSPPPGPDFPNCCGSTKPLKSTIKIFCVIIGVVALLHSSLSIFLLITPFIGNKNPLPHLLFFIAYFLLAISPLESLIGLYIASNLKDYEKSLRLCRQAVVYFVMVVPIGLLECSIIAYFSQDPRYDGRLLIMWVLIVDNAIVVSLLGYMIILVSYFAQEVKYTFGQPKQEEEQEEPAPEAIPV